MVKIEHSGLIVLARHPAVVGGCEGLWAIDCAWCGFVHLDPLPSRGALDLLYSDSYYRVHHADLFRKEKREQWYWRLVYRERLREFAQLTGRYVVRLLDYGAGFGWFVRCAEHYRDWDGVVFDAWGYELGAGCGGKGLTNKVFSDIPARAYDAVHLSFVLEHVRDPLATLREIRGLLKPGGVLCIVVPHELNELQRRLRRRGYMPLHPHHLNYFPPDTLRRLAERAGFAVLRATATFPIEALAVCRMECVNASVNVPSPLL